MGSLGYSPARFNVVEAVYLLDRPEIAVRLKGAVVFVGASYAASGDLLKAEGMTRVKVMTPDGGIKTVVSRDDYVVEALVPPSSFNRVVAILKMFGASDLSESWAAAHLHQGLSRGPGQPAPAPLPPMPAVRQRVGLGGPLLLRREGTGPFSIAIRDAAAHENAVETTATVAELPLDGLAPGPALVRLGAADGSAVIDIELVPATTVPVIPGEPDAPEVARSTWLLLRANAA